MDTDMALGYSPGSDDAMALVDSQIGMASAESTALGTNMVRVWATTYDHVGAKGSG